jgi:hypothetical protein
MPALPTEQRAWLPRALLALLIVTASSCGPSATEPSEPARGGRSGLAGQVIAASDVAGRPDTPLAQQLVLAVRFEQSAGLLGIGDQTLAPATLRFLKVLIPAADPAIHTAVSDATGAYDLVLDPGSYVICLAESEQQPPGFPARTRGCGRSEVPPGVVKRVDLSSGFGEVLLIDR